MKFFKFLDKHFEEIVMVALLITIAIVMMLSVIMRYVFSNALSWAEELCCYCYIWFVFISIPFCIKRESSMKIDLLINRLYGKAGLFVRVVGDVLILAFSLYVTYYSIGFLKTVIKTSRLSASLGIPMSWIYISPVLGFGLTCIRVVQRAFQSYSGIVHRKKPKEV